MELPEVTYKDLKKIEYPVFVLPKENIYYRNKVLFHNDQAIDDRSVKGKSLGVRRLRSNHPLYPLRKAAFDFVSMIRSDNRHFIDSKGKTFTYKKSKFCKVISHSIIKIDYKDTASLVWVQNINSPYIVPRPPPAGIRWVSIIYMGKRPWLIYDFTETPQPLIKRMI